MDIFPALSENSLAVRRAGAYNRGQKNAGGHSMEQVLHGYCRTLDAARTVFVEQDGGEPDIDCDYDVCPHRPVCEIARQIGALLEQTGAE